MTRTVKLHEERYNEILDKAQELFFTKGYEQSSIQDIIDGVGIAKGTFYHYFSSKIQLLDELVERMLDQTVQMVQPIFDDENLDALEKFHLFFSTIENWKIDNKTFFKSILQVFYNDDNILLRHKLKAASVTATTLPLSKIVRQGLEEGIFDTCCPDEIGAIVMEIGQSLAETIVGLLLGKDEDADPLLLVERKIAVTHYAIERLLGAPAGSVQLFDYGRLKQWFEPEKVPAVISIGK
jgi:AcrR family transcriptional regulator